MHLNYKLIGKRGPAVLILHGLLGSSRNWLNIGRKLSDHYRVILPDLRNHGDSPHSTSMDYAVMSEDIVALLNQLEIENPILVGHSMGGKVAMWTALTQARKFSKLIVVDIAPTHYTSVFDRVVGYLQALPVDTLQRRVDVDSALAANISDAGLRQFLLQNLVLDDGRYRWRIDLDLFREFVPIISNFPDTSGLQPCLEDVLFIGGADSSYLHGEKQATIFRLFPNAQIKLIPACGHWLHAEKPTEFLTLFHDAVG